MGTNFYIKAIFDKPLKKPMSIDLEDPSIHIGKRSAAGPYCWDCGITLCKKGEDSIHYENSGLEDKWHEGCPICLKKHMEDAISSKGVRHCCSFTWAQEPEEFRRKMTQYLYSKKWIVIDENGVRYTFRQFLKELDFCPIQFINSVGTYFS